MGFLIIARSSGRFYLSAGVLTKEENFKIGRSIWLSGRCA